MHSGRQFGGIPKKSGKQEHEGLAPESLHCELGPQGDGMHGFSTGFCGITSTKTDDCSGLWKLEKLLLLL